MNKQCSNCNEEKSITEFHKMVSLDFIQYVNHVEALNGKN